MSYQIILPQFEGPFDLLLFFIERDELNIYDIPIYKITNEFLLYIRGLKTKNIDVAGEFILVAATLMKIKAKMLLPRKEFDEHGNEIDPRQELVQQLLEYKKFKAIIDELRFLEGIRVERITRGNIKKDLTALLKEINLEEDLETISLYKLMTVFNKAMDRYKYKTLPVDHKVLSFKYNIEDCKNQLIKIFQKSKKVGFKAVFEKCEDKIHAVVMFLAILEMTQSSNINIFISEGYNNFILTPVVA